MLTDIRRARVLSRAESKDSKPTWFPKAILAGAVAGGAHGYLRPHSAFSGGIELGGRSMKGRLAGAVVGSTVGAGIGWLPQIAYEGLGMGKQAMRAVTYEMDKKERAAVKRENAKENDGPVRYHNGVPEPLWGRLRPGQKKAKQSLEKTAILAQMLAKVLIGDKDNPARRQTIENLPTVAHMPVPAQSRIASAITHIDNQLRDIAMYRMIAGRRAQAARYGADDYIADRY